MKIKHINFVKDFTDCPGGRKRNSSDKSGEEFRDDILLPALNDHDQVVLDLEGAFGYPSSFLDEVFGKVVDQKGVEWLRSRLVTILTDDPVSEREIREIVERHSRSKK
ncbi:MAG: STAS-like domain-containing protein [Opitutales bacterium]|nr:STAS-like domain-containing protein [Opitutales bacterium]